MSFAGFDGGVEVTSGGLIAYAVYTAVLIATDTTPAVRSGTLTGKEQR